MAHWADRLKDGEVLVIRDRDGRLLLDSVDYLTAKQVVTKKGYRFRRADGNQVGDHGYYFSVLERRATVDDVVSIQAETRRVSLASKLANVKWRTLPLETLEAIAALLTPEPASRD